MLCHLLGLSYRIITGYDIARRWITMATLDRLRPLSHSRLSAISQKYCMDMKYNENKNAISFIMMHFHLVVDLRYDAKHLKPAIVSLL